MSALVDRVLTPGGLPETWSYSIRVPLLGALWVAVNGILVGLGTQIPYPMGCSFLAGIIDGTVLSIIAVAKASERFQSSMTGLLGGLSLSGLRSDGSMIWKATQALHALVDQVLHGVGTEKLHQVIEQETLYVIWTTIFVVMASLVAQWVRTARSKP
jgi:hypothetical protein